MEEKEVIEQIQSILDSKSKDMITNYSKIQEILNSPYNLPEVDSLRHEICLCIIFNLYQASITLTNHLMEKFLKLFLAYHYSEKEDENNMTKDVKEEIKENGIINSIANHFKEGNEKYNDIDLHDSINLAAKKGIITKEHKNKLHLYRKNFRNAFSHADNKKTFGDSTISVTGMGIEEGEIVSEPEQLQKVFDLPMVHGLMQIKIAQMMAIPFFKDVDSILRYAKSVVLPSSDKEI